MGWTSASRTSRIGRTPTSRPLRTTGRSVPGSASGPGRVPATALAGRVVGPYLPARERPTLVGMFVRYFIEVPLPAAQVERSLLASPSEWLSAVAGAAQERGDGLLAEVGVGPLGTRLRRRVQLRLGAPVRFPSMTSLPLTWEPVGLEGLLPRLDASIELGSLGEDRTQLAISARYRPPLGAVGQVIDRILLHRVAEATVKDFLDQLGHAVSLSQPDPAGRTDP
jgi:hypothetical protein